MLNVIDDYSRECLACIIDTSLSGRRVVRELSAIAERRGLPCMVVSDNGTELTSHAVLAWCQDTRVEWHYIAPGRWWYIPEEFESRYANCFRAN